MPRVSVCIPTYNCARYLGEAIESVLAQSFEDWELIVCDDASTDDTPELCRRFADKRIRYIRYAQNAGQAGNFNRCFHEASGEFITLLSADDFFLAGLLADRVAHLERDSGLGFVVGATQVVNETGGVTGVSCAWPENRAFAEREFVKPLLFGAVVNTLSLVVRKVVLEKAGLFRTDLTWGHDWEWILRLAESSRCYYVSQPLAAYRVHDASGTAEQLSAAKNGPQERRILQDALRRLENVDKEFTKLRRPAFRALSRRHMYFAEQALVERRRRVARSNLRYAMMAFPWMLVRPTFWALLVGSFFPLSVYKSYRSARGLFAAAHGASV